MRRTKEDAELTRQQLLDIGCQVFGDKGYAATRLSDIAEKAGVTRGAIYWHFKNKKQLFIALFQEKVEPFFEIVGKVLDEDLRPLQVLHKTMSLILDEMEKNAEFRSQQALDAANRKVQQDIPELREYMIKRTRKFLRKATKIIQKGQEMGEIRNDIAPDAIIGTYLTLFRGYAFLLTQDSLLPIVKRDMSEDIVQIFIKGIKA